MRIDYQVTCPAFTVWVQTDGDGIIRECAPLVRRFRGQHLQRLMTWASRTGGKWETWRYRLGDDHWPTAMPIDRRLREEG